MKTKSYKKLVLMAILAMLSIMLITACNPVELPGEVTVTFVGGEGAELGGDGGALTQTIERGGNATAPVLEREGYDFDGWEGTFTGVLQDTVVTAKWKAKLYTITFDTKGGTQLEDITLEYSKKVDWPNDPKKEGHAFAGWFADAACTTPFEKFERMPAKNTDVYASWEANKYTVKFDANGGRWIPKEDSGDREQLIEFEGTAIAPNFELDGYKLSWDKPLGPIKKATTITAVWTPEDPIVYHQVTFDGAGGYWTGGGTFIQTVKEGGSAIPPTLVKEGYTFDGWIGDYTNITEDVTITAKWENKTFTIKFFDGTEGEDDDPFYTAVNVEYGDPVQPFDSPTLPGQTFIRWDKDFSYVKEDLEIYAIWERNTYTVTFDANGGSFESGASQTIISDIEYDGSPTNVPDDPQKEGYTFDGWLGDYTNIRENVTITAQWIAIPVAETYTVTFNGDGGYWTGGGTFIQTVEKDKSAEAPELVKADYDLVGWFLDNEEEPTNVADYKVTGSVTFTAKWEEIPTPVYHQVVFNGDGGYWTGGGNHAQTIEHGEKVIAATYEKEGYDFECWTQDPDAEDVEEFDFEATLIIEDIILYAKWNIKVFTVKFMDGNALLKVESVEYGKSATAPDDPEKDGYTFLTWSNNAYDYITRDLTIKAIWSTPSAYSVSFYGGDGAVWDSNSEDYTQYITHGKYAIAPVFTKDGYDFDYWYTTDSTVEIKVNEHQITQITKFYIKWSKLYTVEFNGGDGGVYQSGEVTVSDVRGFGDISEEDWPIYNKEGFNFDKWDIAANEDTATITATALWKIEQFTISFESNGGSEVDAIKEEFATPVSAPADPEKEGHDFVGWCSDEDLEILYTFTTMPAADITLYAKWQINQYTITFNSNEGSEVAAITQYYNTDVTAPADPEKEGHDFVGWFTDNETFLIEYEFTTMPANSFTLYAKWRIEQFKISFESNGGSEVEAIEEEFATDVTAPTPPTKEGYDFKGWFTDDETFLIEYEFTTMPAVDITLYAKWQINQYTITFNSNEGSAVAAITQDYNTNVMAPDAPTKTGYTFDGWFSDEGLESPYTFGTMPAEDITLYAQWEANTYTVTFDANDGDTPTPESKTVTYDSVYGGLATVTRTGYTFDGWYTEKTSGEQVTAGTTVTITADQTLYAQWTANSYTVVFNANTGTGSMDAQSFVYDTLQALTENTFLKTGYNFTGWNTQAEGDGGDAYADKASVNNLTSDANGEVILYARWIAKGDIVVTFDVNDGNALEENQKEVTYDVAYGELPTVTRTGHKFIGWYTQITGGDKVEATTKVENAVDHTLYARWERELYTVTFILEGEDNQEAEVLYQDKVNATDYPTWIKPGYTLAYLNFDIEEDIITNNIEITCYWVLNDGATSELEGFYNERTHLSTILKPYNVGFETGMGGQYLQAITASKDGETIILAVECLYQNVNACATALNNALDSNLTNVSYKHVEGTNMIVVEGLFGFEYIFQDDFTVYVDKSNGIALYYTNKDTTVLLSLVFEVSTCSTFTIPDGITTISHAAFYGNTRLTQVVFPHAVHVGDYAFAYCAELTSVELPAGSSTGYRAFYSCENLETVKIGGVAIDPENAPNNAYGLFNSPGGGGSAIGAQAFEGCTSLTSVTLPVGTTIGLGAFDGCPQDLTVTMEPEGGGDPIYTKYIGGILYELDSEVGTVLVKVLSDISALNFLAIPDYFTEIGGGVFATMQNLASVTIPASVITMGSGVFNNADLIIYIETEDQIEDWDANWCLAGTVVYIGNILQDKEYTENFEGLGLYLDTKIEDIGLTSLMFESLDEIADIAAKGIIVVEVAGCPITSEDFLADMMTARAAIMELMTDGREYLYELNKKSITFPITFSYGTSTKEITIKLSFSDAGLIREADFVATDRVGIAPHDGALYQEYALMYGGKISLKAGEIKSITLSYNGGGAIPLTPDTDTTLWFSVMSEAGTYTFIIIDNDDIIYEAILDWEAPLEKEAVLQNNGKIAEGGGKYYLYYKIEIDLQPGDSTVYMIGPDKKVSNLGILEDGQDIFNLWFRVTDATFNLVNGEFTFLVKKVDQWYTFTVEYYDADVLDTYLLDLDTEAAEDFAGLGLYLDTEIDSIDGTGKMVELFNEIEAFATKGVFATAVEDYILTGNKQADMQGVKAVIVALMKEKGSTLGDLHNKSIDITVVFKYGEANETVTFKLTFSDVGLIRRADFVETNRVGIAPHGAICQEYKLMYDGNKISLADGAIKSITLSIDGGEASNPLPLNPDTTLWFDVMREAGTYTYIIIDNNDIIYEAIINWIAPEELDAGLQSTTVVKCGDGIYRLHYIVNLDVQPGTGVVYRIKPNGDANQETLLKDSDDVLNIYFRPTDASFTQTPGVHTYMIKKGGVWFKAIITVYTITFESNDGTDCTAIDTCAGAAITLPVPTKDYYDFAGWFDEALENEFTDELMPAENITLYAKWTATEYNITYNNVDGATNPNAEITSYTILTEAITLEDAEKEGYAFGGWFTTANFAAGTEITQAAGGTTGDKVLYAKWEATEYDITYNLDGGTNDSANPAKYTIKTETITLADATKDGYEFEGWFNADGNLVTGIAKGSTGDITLNARWYTAGLEFAPIKVEDEIVAYSVTGGPSAASEIIIPEYYSQKPVTAIANSAFEGFWENLTTVFIPTSVTTIGVEAFEQCEKLTAVTFAEGSQLNSIGTYAFSETAITTFTVPEGTQTVGWGAFRDCTSLTEVNIPASVTNIRDWAFADCPMLEAINIATGNTIYSSLDGVFFNKAQTELFIYPESKPDTDYIVPNTVTIIGSQAFDGVRYLVNIILPDNLKEIGSAAFQGCCLLETIAIPDGITTIEEWTFGECSITSITFGIDSQLSTIQEGAFNQSALETIIIPKTVISIEGYAFSNCDNLEEVLFEEGSILESIGYAAFQESPKLNNVDIPNSVVSISDAAFKKCTSLTDISLPINSSFTTLSSNMFAGCTSLERIVLPDNITTVESNIFQGCTSLTDVTLSTNLTSISSYMFSNTAFVNFVIPDNITTIGGYAFRYCANLKSISIPSSVTTINSYAFADCPKLNTIIIPNSVETIATDLFRNNSQDFTVYTEATEKPSGWKTNWDRLTTASTFAAVVWGCELDGDGKVLSFTKSSTNPSNAEGKTLSNPVDMDYTFEGWNTKSDFSGDCYGTIADIPYNTKVYAKWTKEDNGNDPEPGFSYEGDEFTYNGSILTGYNGSGGEIEIPEGTTEIEINAFVFPSSFGGYATITIPDSVATVASGAFVNDIGALLQINVPFAEGNKPDGWDPEWCTGEGTVISYDS